MFKKSTIPFTQNGFQKIKKEYDELLDNRKKAVTELSTARDMGDRSENAAYKSARFKLSGIDRRIRFLQRLIDNAQVMNPINSNEVQIGTFVKVDNGKHQFTYQIVGEYEADPMNGQLSYKSPVGTALLNKTVGETVVINTPKGSINYKIIEIRI